jgi:putative NADH-flavin reductase
MTHTLACFGATGRTGGAVVTAALARGWTVRALARDPARLPAGVTAVRGDVLDPAAVAAVVAGSDAVISALGGGSVTDPGSARADGIRHIIAAMRAAGVRRVLAVGGGGVLDAPGGGLRSERPQFPAAFRLVSAQHRAAWEALAASGLDWTYACPPDIVDGPPAPRVLVAADVMPDGASRRITTGSLARFLVDECDTRAFVGRRVGLAEPA